MLLWYKSIWKKLRKGDSMVRTGALKAVHDDDLDVFLKSLGIYDDIVSGKITCVFCEATVTLENLYSVFPYKGAVGICCSGKDCRTTFFESGYSND